MSRSDVACTPYPRLASGSVSSAKHTPSNFEHNRYLLAGGKRQDGSADYVDLIGWHHQRAAFT